MLVVFILLLRTLFNEPTDMEKNDLNTLYSPRMWSKRGTSQEVFDNHVNFVRAVSREVRQKIPAELNIPYSSKKSQKFDIYGTDLPEDSPVFIYIHGGYWQYLNKDISSYVVEPLYTNKIKSVIIDYTRCPNTTVSGIVDEVKDAVEKCLQLDYTSKSRKVFIAGHSAGAHLTISLIQELTNKLPPSSLYRISGLFLISGLFDLTPLIETYVNKGLKLDKQTAAAVSPQLHDIPAKFSYLKFFVIVGEYESPAFIQQSKKFHRKLESLNFNSTFILQNGMDHFDLVENLCSKDYELTQFILNVYKSS